MKVHKYELPSELRRILDQNEKIIELNTKIATLILNPPINFEESQNDNT